MLLRAQQIDLCMYEQDEIDRKRTQLFGIQDDVKNKADLKEGFSPVATIN